MAKAKAKQRLVDPIAPGAYRGVIVPDFQNIATIEDLKRALDLLPKDLVIEYLTVFGGKLIAKLSMFRGGDHEKPDRFGV